ncbi:S-adenosylmethionine synthetase [Spiroplasma sp. TIUS-1]|uniref:methionine adenosyltransferase n=1 Tax=Spiroplasma sp. TIUS-1 TaxID=216963 RepID=UPI0013973E14|nr:methionine adenosyltransferase [Spiroplasma sp. TIUS-1]QHX35792.1 S-adenosylmethionine synthetase [Spiroplasma sp. TIUS-1]
MTKNKILFTSESVSEGHPDKLCDQISDAILDACLKEDPYSRVACETFACNDYLVVGGEITTKAKVNYEQIVRNVIKGIGYDDSQFGIDWKTLNIEIKLNTQSSDIAEGLKDEDSLGAGDQGIMFGYATNETHKYMPLAIQISHELVYLATKLRKSNEFKWAKPDMKSQVTIDYTDPANPKIDNILMSIQHDPKYIREEFIEFITNKIMKVVASEFNMNDDFKILINPTGIFTIGGPKGDTGLTGRKIIVDTYGGYARHGGGAFSGKDATKVDRSAAYMCRYAAKNIVVAGLADKIEIQVSYAIGVAKPVSIFIETFGTEKIAKDKILNAINSTFDFSVSSILKTLNLRKPIFQKTAAYGHFGKEGFSWENLDKVSELKKFL